MNLTDQLGALESSLDELILAAASPSASVLLNPAPLLIPPQPTQPLQPPRPMTRPQSTPSPR